MLKSYHLKLYPNKEKSKQLDQLLRFWREEVNRKIELFWKIGEIKDRYPPKEHTRGGRIVRDASVKAWQIVKGAKKVGQKKKPVFKGSEIDLNNFSAYMIEGLVRERFDIWFNIISLTPRKRLKLPSKRYRVFNEAVEHGVMKKSFKLFNSKWTFYITAFVEIPERKAVNEKLVGLDVGLARTVTTSNNQIFGNGLRSLRIRTKWRTYEKLSAFKQGLNRVAKEIVVAFPDCDFAVEKLLFKGKRKRSREFRRRNNNWAYAHLSRMLTTMGPVEGFNVYYVNPAYTSQTCPACGFIDERNRISVDAFQCSQCGFAGNADHIGALNLCERVLQEHPSLQLEIIGGIQNGDYSK